MQALREIRMKIRVKKLDKLAVLPERMTDGSAGYDLRFSGGNIYGHESVRYAELRPGVNRIPTGLAFEIPDGHVGLVTGRSGLNAEGHPVHLGVIDADYRGEVTVLLNVGESGLTIYHQERIGQLLIVPVANPEFEEAKELSETARGQGGFGSTGKR
jgi:dUTP pyrophosphatase